MDHWDKLGGNYGIIKNFKMDANKHMDMHTKYKAAQYYMGEASNGYNNIITNTNINRV